MSATPEDPGFIGFTGFTDNTKWDYSLDDHYPELAAFSAAEATDWGDEATAALVRAYSKSSTSGVQLETWDYGLDTTTGKFVKSMDTDEGKKVYCTVRDMTSGFDLTSSADVVSWLRTGTADSKTEQKTKALIAGTEHDVLSLKHQNYHWLADELITGIEWLMVSCKAKVVDDQTVTATRRLRVIPTAAIEAGESVVVTNKYDHADDVMLLFSTAQRMASSTATTQNTYDVTTGIFPDRDSAAVTGANDFIAQQHTLMDNVRGTTDINNFDAFPDDNDKLRDVSVGYMSKAYTDPPATDNAANGKLYVYLYEVDSIGSKGEINTGKLLKWDDDSEFKNKFNGYDTFKNTDTRYLLTYMWVLNDGRVLQDAKLIRRAKAPFTVEMNVYCGTLDSKELYSYGAMTYSGTDTTGYTLNNAPKSTDDAVAAYAPAVTAWKAKKSTDTLTALRLTFITKNNSGTGKVESYTVTVDNPTDGTIISVPYTFYRIVYQNGGYFTIPEKVNREYTLKQDGDVYYLLFDKKNEEHTVSDENKLYLNDVESNILVEAAYDGKITPPIDPDEPTPIPPTPTPTPEPDRPELNKGDHFAYIIGRNTDGTSEPLAQPEENITRAEAATIFFRLLTDESRTEYWSTSSSYGDVESDAWYNNAVSTLQNAGIMIGTDGSFRPDDDITRAELAVMATRFDDFLGVDGSVQGFPDTVGHWAEKEISHAAAVGWVQGYPDGSFKPDQSITRAETMTLINRVLERAVESGGMLDGMIRWTDNADSAKWYYEDVQEATNSHEYTRTAEQVPDHRFFYEQWTAITPPRDWAALEKEWSTANSGR